MAFFSKFGGILRQASSRNVTSDLLRVNSSIFQGVRWMSTPSSKVFIGGISYSTDDQSLKEAFARYGEVIEARIIMDRETGRSRGFGFVTFTSSEEASSAIQALDGQELHGRRVKVNYANDRPRSNFGGDGYGGGGGGYGGGSGYGGGYGGGGSYGGGGDGGYGGGGYGGGSNYGGAAPAYGSNDGAGGGYSGGAPGYGNTSTGGYGGGSASSYGNTSAGGYGGDSVQGYGNTNTGMSGGYGEPNSASNFGTPSSFSNEGGGYGGTTETQVGSDVGHFGSNPRTSGYADGSGDFNSTQGDFQDADDEFGKAGGSRN